MAFQDLTGQILGQYELRARLGAGGMGVVYRAYQHRLEREVALKILPPELARTQGYLDRFYREARTAAALEHTHIVPIYDYGVHQEYSYLAMRLLTGGTLARRIEERQGTDTPLPAPDPVPSTKSCARPRPPTFSPSPDAIQTAHGGTCAWTDKAVGSRRRSTPPAQRARRL